MGVIEPTAVRKSKSIVSISSLYCVTRSLIIVQARLRWHVLASCRYRKIDVAHRSLQVEPFNRALKEQGADVMINGRRRDHGFERAFLEVRSPLLGMPRLNVQLDICCSLAASVKAGRRSWGCATPSLGLSRPRLRGPTRRCPEPVLGLSLDALNMRRAEFQLTGCLLVLLLPVRASLRLMIAAVAHATVKA